MALFLLEKEKKILNDDKKEIKKKISLLILCGIIFLGACGCSNKEAKKDEQTSDDNSIGNYKYETTIKCDVINNIKNIYPYGLLHIIITNDNQIYYLSINQLYSNNMNCKKIDDIEFSMIYQGRIIDKNGNDYDYNYSDNSITKVGNISSSVHNIIKDNNIIKSERNIIDDNSTYLLLSGDGVIYNGQIGSGGDLNGIDDVVIKYDDEKIKDFYVMNMDLSSISNAIKYIITDKSFYTYTRTITNEEECNKYADIKCQSTYEWVKNEEVSNQINEFVGITPWMLIKNNGNVFINVEIQREFFGG